MITADIATSLPEVVLAGFAIAGLMYGAFGGQDRVAGRLLWATAGLFVALAVWLGLIDSGRQIAFGGMYIDDAFARFAKITILLSAAAVLVMGQPYLQRRDLMRFEYPVLITLSVIGMMMMVSAGDLMALYMGLELQSLALYGAVEAVHLLLVKQ